MHQIHIMGAGAMGCLWCSYFSSQLASIHLIVRANSPWLNTSTPLTYNPNGRTIALQTATLDTLSPGSIHHLVLATKAQDALDSLKTLSPYLHKDCQIVLLQNGMGSQQAISEQFSEFAVYVCSSTEGAYKTSYNAVMHAGKGENQIGPMTPLATHQRIATWLPKDTFTWHDDITPVLWRKLVINAAINPLTVKYQCKNGGLLENQEALQHMKKVCAELQLLTAAQRLNFGDIFALATSVCRQTAHNYSSMYKDHEAHRPTEISFINGFVVEQAKKLDVACLENQKLVQYILQS